MNDRELIAGIRRQDQEAYNEFDQRFRVKIEAFVRKRGVPASDCADVTQDVLADAIRQIQQGKFRHEAALATWLHPIMKGWVVNFLRKSGRFETVSLDDVSPDHASLVATHNIDSAIAVNDALSCLSTEDHLVLVLHDQQRLTLEEIGQILRLRKSAVGERLARARELFCAAIRDGGSIHGRRRLKE